MNTVFLAPAVVLLAGATAGSEVRYFDIAEQPLASALLQIARQGNVNILASERLTRGHSAPAVRGSMTATQAVERVLANSGLDYRVTRDGTVVIFRRKSAARPTPPKPASKPRPRVAKTVPAPPPLPVKDIVVQAQRRSENAQEIPLALTAFEQETMSLAGVHKAFDLQQLDSSLVISAQSGAIIPFLRGIGNPASATPGNESSVPVYIDDVYLARLYPPYLTLDHVDRVEVLKGPQGTLFGRNSTGGLIQIFTRDPGREPEFDTELELANFQTVTGKAYVAGPLGEQAAANLSVSVRNQGEGWGRNLFTGKDAYSTDYYVLRSKLLWTPTETTTIRLSGLYVRENSSVGTVQGGGFRKYPRGMPPDYDQPFDQPEGFYDIATNFPTIRKHRGWGVTLKIDRTFDFAELSSISSYRKSKDPWTSEGDHTPYPWLQYTLPVTDRQLTQELQLKSRPGSAISWILGLYYMDALASIDPTSITGEAVTRNGIDSLNLVARQGITSKAVYGQATFPLGSEKDHLTLGMRYTSDRVHGAGDQYVIDSATGERNFIAEHIDDVSKFDQVTYKIAFDHKLADEIIAYGWYSRGFKSGTYNLLPLELPALNPEKVDAFEIGMKAALLDERLRINLAAFHNNVSDPQVQIVKNVGGVATNQYVNAERARSRGVDFSVRFSPSPGLALRMTGQYLDSRFLRFRNAPFNAPNFAPPYGVTTTSGDASGNQTPNSPHTKLNAGFTYRFDAGPAELTVDGNLAYRGSFKWEPDNFITEPALTLLNASVTAEPENMPGWSLRVWGNNLTNQKYLGNMLTQSGPVGFMASPAEPRTFGLAIRYRN